MRKALAVAVVLVCGLFLSSCSLLPFGGLVFDDSHVTADAQMEKITAALNDHDAGALKAMFSPYALQKASGVDEGLNYLLSYFPNGGVTWTSDSINSDGHNAYGKKSEVLQAYYKVSADGKDYWFYFADFWINEVENPNNVGIYAMGVTPWAKDLRFGVSGLFSAWAGSIGLTDDHKYGYPGIYVPLADDPALDQLADARMQQIASALDGHDPAALKALFSEHAIGRATTRKLDLGMQQLLLTFPNGGLTWERQLVSDKGDDRGEGSRLLTNYYKVSADGKDYWLFFADFVENTVDPDNVGLASLAVSPWYDPGSTDYDQEFSYWAGTWTDPGDVGSPGIYVPAG